MNVTGTLSASVPQVPMSSRRDPIRRIVASCLAASVALSACETGSEPSSIPSATPTSAELNITPIAQQTEVWCWAASAEMILLYFNEPNVNPGGDYQCGIVGGYWFLVGGPNHPCVYNCYLCQTGASSTAEIQRILMNYGRLAQLQGLTGRTLTTKSKFGQLTIEQIAYQLDNNRPILAGISFPGQPTLPGISGHAVVFSGYDATGAQPTITVRDPYPYEAFIPPQQNPWLLAGGVYLGPGTYRIPLAALGGGEITWGNTIYDIH